MERSDFRARRFSAFVHEQEGVGPNQTPLRTCLITWQAVSREVRCSKDADSGAGAGEAVLASRRKIFRETECAERIGVARGNFGGCGAAEKITQQRDEAAHERRIGIAAKLAPAFGIDGGGEVNNRYATADAVVIRALVRGQRRQFFRTVNDDGEALLGIVDHGEVVGEEALFFG